MFDNGILVYVRYFSSHSADALNGEKADVANKGQKEYWIYVTYATSNISRIS